jgi:hypothetical protein
VYEVAFATDVNETVIEVVEPDVALTVGAVGVDNCMPVICDAAEVKLSVPPSLVTVIVTFIHLVASPETVVYVLLVALAIAL